MTLSFTISTEPLSDQLEEIRKTQETLAGKLDLVLWHLSGHVPRPLRHAIGRLSVATNALDAAVTKFHWCNPSQPLWATQAMGNVVKDETKMAADLSDEIASVENAVTVITSATTLINGFQARLDAAIAAALADGATAEQLQPLSDLSVALGASASDLAAAVAANTPAA